MEKEQTVFINRELKIKCLLFQLSPELKKVNINLQKAESSLIKYNKNDKIDILMFPEMAFTGYTFKNREDIREFCEE